VNNVSLSSKKKVTVMIPDPAKGEVVLPKPLSATIISERVKGIKNQQETELEVVHDVMGIARARVDENYDKLGYTIDSPIHVPLQLDGISQKAYHTFKAQFTHP
jgi:hypothetical protein